MGYERVPKSKESLVLVANKLRLSMIQMLWENGHMNRNALEDMRITAFYVAREVGN